jgi:ABC-type glycerol-3-phosphate transport system substrate-binding protein
MSDNSSNNPPNNNPTDNNPTNNSSADPSKKGISRRDFLKIGSGVALGGLAAGLGAKSAQAANVARSKVFPVPTILQGATINLKLLTWFWAEPGRGDAWRAMIEKFHGEQNDIRIEEAGWPFDEYTNQVLVQVRGGQIDGDLMTTTPDLFLRLLRAQQLEPLQDIVDRLGHTMSGAHDAVRNENGDLMGLDIVTVRFGLLYNNAMFEADGISEPTSIDEWVAASKALTKRPDQFGLHSPHIPSEPESTWFILQQWAVLYDGKWAEGQTPLVTSDAVINGLKLFKTMFDEAMPQGTDTATANRMYATSKLAQQLIVSAAVNIWKTEGPEIYESLRSAQPFWPSQKAITRIHPLTVNVNSQNKDASKVFVEWLYKTENYQELLERCLDVIPAFEGGIRQEYLDSLFWSDGYQSAQAITPPDVMGEYIFYNQEFGNIVLNQFQQCLTGGLAVEDAMAAAQTELEALGERVFTS